MSPSSILLVLVSLLPGADAVAPPVGSWMKSAADYSQIHGGQTMVVLYDGNLVYERYDNGGTADKLQGLVSGCKSFVGVAAGPHAGNSWRPNRTCFHIPLAGVAWR